MNNVYTPSRYNDIDDQDYLHGKIRVACFDTISVCCSIYKPIFEDMGSSQVWNNITEALKQKGEW